MSEIKLGDLISFKTHPFVKKLTNVKISAYADYTSPILVVKEIKEKTFDKVTGTDVGQQLHCIYYNSKDGKFLDKWINSNLVNKIFFSIIDNKFLYEFNFQKKTEENNKDLSVKNYESLIKENYLNKKVVLKSVDVELYKKKINRTAENGELVETNHLEFLPPIMTVIGYKIEDIKNKFCEKTGVALKPQIELKCKWYNSNSKSFSESSFPHEILYLVKDIQDLFLERDLLSDIAESIEENAFFNLPLSNTFLLEGNINIAITHTIGHSESTIYKHYFYQMNYFDYISQNKAVITIDSDFSKKTENSIFGRKYPDYHNGFRLKITDCKFNIDAYYLIVYRDTYKNITKRIVKITGLYMYVKDFNEFKDTYTNLRSWTLDHNPSFINYNYHDDGNIFIHVDGEIIPDNTLPKTIFEDQNVEIILKTNCLLRKGKIRNFKISNILEVREIINGNFLFEELF
ncbi:hypothetical protein [[Flexibacter] sp. ATCC 35103]|uniref:hypothetical protein n=1 Tax=[Flexibacter] sp. ATCC 35103 TaxID=1937528 RepID=UPI0009CC8D57|nr:hypothetical protein [[Flexibacter] sp. ATCC 35103]OMQ13091.1 hypothetical protein BXU01_00985 [[Flexibacter] sp. ATCC 35103]